MSSEPMDTKPEPGCTCRIGGGKTVWEIISVARDGMLELSALGRGGYVNKYMKPEAVNDVQPARLTTTLGDVLAARRKARDSAASLADRLRFMDKHAYIRNLAFDAHEFALSYSRLCERHTAQLADLGIKEN